MAVKKYYQADKMKRLTQHYTVGDLWLNPGYSSILLDTNLVEALELFWQYFGAAPQFVTINSLYRSKENNIKAGGAKNSLHVQGRAADFRIPGVKRLELAQFAEKIKGRGGIGVYGSASEHIHFDTGSKRQWWVITSNSNTPGFGGVPVTFKKGHRSPAIVLIQQALNAAGYKGKNGKILTEDGDYGLNTQYAVISCQKDHGITADGKYGKQINAIFKVFNW